ncbi:MAG: alpha/beta fold hydrolase [Desulfocurvibacter africanus]
MDIRTREDIACLLLHGFTGEPFEMEPLLEHLLARGIHAEAPLLPGHGKGVAAFAASSFSEWAEASEQAYLELRARFAAVAVVGLSMGGSLALRIGQRHQPAGIVTMAAPVYIYRWFPPEVCDWRLPLVGMLRRVTPMVKTRPPSPESRAIAPWQGIGEVMCLEQLHSLMQGLKPIRRDLGAVRAPLLVLHAPGDRIVPVGNAWEIVRRVGSSRRRLEFLPIQERITSRHVLTTHRETRAQVCELVEEFVMSLECNSPAGFCACGQQD